MTSANITTIYMPTMCDTPRRLTFKLKTLVKPPTRDKTPSPVLLEFNHIFDELFVPIEVQNAFLIPTKLGKSAGELAANKMSLLHGHV